MSEPIYMLNGLWLRKDGGKEKYLEYTLAVSELLAAAGGEVGRAMQPRKALIGEWGPDLFFVVKYPNQSAFQTMIRSAEYVKIAHLREEALERSILIECNEFEWG